MTIVESARSTTSVTGANWEYTRVSRAAEAKFLSELNELGSLGWELVDVDMHRGVVIGELYAVLKRPALSFAPPEPMDANWHRDPSERFDQRYWDGVRWTEHVTGPNGQAIDHPVVNRR
ncbi:MAG: hypothetical protein JWN99_233 [Ilumatobacteraceae bacterium]|nr:hypothetical protein [Ilumatobacteraceae bacterium]